MSEGEKTDWSRGPKKADLGKVSVHKLDQAARERGIRVNIERVGRGKVQAQVFKTVIEGMPAPKKPWEKLFGKKG